MSQTINRLYATDAQAAAAVAALRDEYYSDIHTVPGASPGTSIDDIVASITRGNVLKYDAKILARSVGRGHALVTVHAPFGGAHRATRILDKFSPLDSGISEPTEHLMAWDEATPMSCILQMPVLLDDATPFSRFWNLPVLSAGPRWFSSLIGIPMLLQGSASLLSSSLGIPVLSNNPAPLSSLLHLPTLARGKSGR